MLVIGTLNKESYSTRGGREHLTIVKAKYIQPLPANLLDGHVDLEELKRDCWSGGMLQTAIGLVQQALQEGEDSSSAEACGE